MAKITVEQNKKYPTVGEMLEYIKEANIPMDAIVTCEHLENYYLKDDKDHTSWDYYTSEDEYGEIKLLPAHNNFGTAQHKKLFVIWMHY